MDRVFSALAAAGIGAYEASFTALDAYRDAAKGPIRFALATCGLQDLAAALDGLRYPGLSFADAALDLDPGNSLEANKNSVSTCYFRCVESISETERAAYAQLELLRDPRRDVFLDPRGAYSFMRSKQLERSAMPLIRSSGELAESELFETAVILSRQDYELDEGAELPAAPASFPIEAQRAMLSLILTGPTPWRGLEYLKRSLFVEAYWPELARLAGTDHSKEYHPEGDAWVHTMETFRHRKVPSLGLSLGLLLHDSGKPVSDKAEGRQFDRHAEIGKSVAERFLTRLEFPRPLIDDATFLVRFHMMPAALPLLPTNRLAGVIDDPRFPVLLELYKCDELSTFRGPDGYYEACAAYKAWLKNSRNPYRGADGKKLSRMYLEPQAAKRLPNSLTRR